MTAPGSPYRATAPVASRSRSWLLGRIVAAVSRSLIVRPALFVLMHSLAWGPWRAVAGRKNEPPELHTGIEKLLGDDGGLQVLVYILLPFALAAALPILLRVTRARRGWRIAGGVAATVLAAWALFCEWLVVTFSIFLGTTLTPLGCLAFAIGGLVPLHAILGVAVEIAEGIAARRSEPA